METPTLLTITERIDAVREDLQFFASQKKYLNQGPNKDNFKKDIDILKAHAKFLLETINNL
jgi:hypothetical protein